MGCSRKRQLLTDCLERVQALAVQMELLLHASESQPESAYTGVGENWFHVEQTSQEVRIRLTRDLESNKGWLRMEEARIQCDIARLALDTHITSHGC